jgi:hypothetical protein
LTTIDIARSEEAQVYINYLEVVLVVGDTGIDREEFAAIQPM